MLFVLIMCLFSVSFHAGWYVQTRFSWTTQDANLLLFKTVIAGDAWGRVAVPVIEYVPLTAIVFCGSLMTTVFGVLNMVIAVTRLFGMLFIVPFCSAEEQASGRMFCDATYCVRSCPIPGKHVKRNS